MSTGRQRFSIIPASAVTDTRLEPRDLQVLCLLGRHTDDLGWCCRSQVKMAGELNCGRATVQRALGRLVNAGYLEHRPKERTSGAAAAHDYRVVIDPPEHGSAPLESSANDAEGVPTGGQGVPIGGQGGARDGAFLPGQQGVGTLQNMDSGPENTPGHPLPAGFEAGNTAENLAARDSGNGQNREARAPMLTTPVKQGERERAGARDGGQEGPQEARSAAGATGRQQEARSEATGKEPEASEADRQALRRRFRKLAGRYEGAIYDKLDEAEGLFVAMAEADRQLAEQRLDPFFAALKGPKGGMKRRPPLQEYLSQRKFDLVEAPEDAAAATLETLKRKLVQGFSRPWWWLWFDLLMRGLAAGGGRWAAARQELDRQTGKAETTGLPWTVDPEKRAEIDAAAERMIQVGRDSPQAMAWGEWCRQLGPDGGGVRMPQPDKAPFVWVPSEWPPDADQGNFSDDEVQL